MTLPRPIPAMQDRDVVCPAVLAHSAQADQTDGMLGLLQPQSLARERGLERLATGEGRSQAHGGGQQQHVLNGTTGRQHMTSPITSEMSAVTGASGEDMKCCPVDMVQQVSLARVDCVRPTANTHFTSSSQASYNTRVAQRPNPHRATHWLLAVLCGLLALGPFLHAHLGFSKVTGFHVAGYNSLVNPHGLAASHPQAEAPELFDAESPAVGVSASLIRLAFDIPCPDGLSLQTLLAVIAVAGVLCARMRPPHVVHNRPSRPRPGLPPPALAPPASSC